MSFCSQGGGGSAQLPPLDTEPPGVGQTPLDADPLGLGRPPLDADPTPKVGQTPLPDTVNKRVVRILLECILVLKIKLECVPNFVVQHLSGNLMLPQL